MTDKFQNEGSKTSGNFQRIVRNIFRATFVLRKRDSKREGLFKELPIKSVLAAKGLFQMYVKQVDIYFDRGLSSTHSLKCRYTRVRRTYL